MKYFQNILTTMALMAMVSCGNNAQKPTRNDVQTEKDTVKKADEFDMSPQTSGFVNKAYESSLMEVQLGELAQRNALNMDVKKFGLMMIQDHQKAANELQLLAKSKKIPLSPTLDNDQQDKVDSLALLNSAGFDFAFLKTMVNDHQKTIADFEQADKEVKDQQIKTFIGQTLPTLKSHLQKAETLNNQLTKKAAAINSRFVR